jgi:peptidyl-prolyl cis-trans isomerase B (cyclophilin B)
MVWPCRCGQDEPRQDHEPEMKRLVVAIAVVVLASARAVLAQPGPVVVVETTKGAFAFETYPNEAPKTVAHILQLVRDGFYDGQHFHRALPGFVIQWGDPRSIDPRKEREWGRGDAASSGAAVGVPEISKKRTHIKGAVALAHPGDPAKADSQIYVTLADRPDLDGRYAVFGRLIAGAEVPARIERGDLITRMYIRD